MTPDSPFGLTEHAARLEALKYCAEQAKDEWLALKELYHNGIRGVFGSQVDQAYRRYQSAMEDLRQFGLNG